MTRSHPPHDMRGIDASDEDLLVSESGLASEASPLGGPLGGPLADPVGDGTVARLDGPDEAYPGEEFPAPPEPDASTFLIGPEAVRAFIAREWKRKLDYRLKKEVWTYSGDQVSILFEYEWHDAEADQWISTYGEEHWEIAPDGLLRRLDASGRDIVIDDVSP